jgi:hypothetical protein
MKLFLSHYMAGGRVTLKSKLIRGFMSTTHKAYFPIAAYSPINHVLLMSSYVK